MGLKEKVIQMLRDNPERLKMDVWGFEEEACGTHMCLGGHICVAAYGELPEYIPGTPENEWHSSGEHPEDAAYSAWQEQYGPESAGKLKFYKFDWTAEDVINHLEEITK